MFVASSHEVHPSGSSSRGALARDPSELMDCFFFFFHSDPILLVPSVRTMLETMQVRLAFSSFKQTSRGVQFPLHLPLHLQEFVWHATPGEVSKRL